VAPLVEELLGRMLALIPEAAEVLDSPEVSEVPVWVGSVEGVLVPVPVVPLALIDDEPSVMLNSSDWARI
jgi:hypothetical protein